jgi:hypothetical protein
MVRQFQIRPLTSRQRAHIEEERMRDAFLSVMSFRARTREQ